jgi:Na+/melibiose symporter-like transporter
MATHNTNPDPALLEAAKKSLKKKRDAKEFLIVTIAVNLVLSVIWWLTTPSGYYWPIWSWFGMGIGVMFAYLDAYTMLGGKPMTDEEIRAEAEKIQKRR